MAVKVDLTGKRFGNVTVLGLAEDVVGKPKRWLCRCDCGYEWTVRGSNLQSGHANNCRKCSFKAVSVARTTHGKRHEKIYNVWYNMIRRCELPNDKSYNNYGARGIKVCEEWHDPGKFFEWAEETGYKHGLELDRIDVNGNYCPENCRWISHTANNNNKRNNVFVEMNGEEHTISEWCRILDVTAKKINYYRDKGYAGDKLYNKLTGGKENE